MLGHSRPHIPLSVDAAELRLLSTLPALSAFIAIGTCFAAKSAAREHDSATEQADHSEGVLDEEYDKARTHRPLLLFLHALAAKPSLRALHLYACGITPYIMDHMPVWTHLLCLSLADNAELRNYTFVDVANRFPSLTWLTSPSRSDAAIEQLARLPRLEELRVSDHTIRWRQIYPDRFFKSEAGYRAHNEAASLRSVLYTVQRTHHTDHACPSLHSLTALCTVVNLTRLTVPAYWLNEAT